VRQEKIWNHSTGQLNIKFLKIMGKPFHILAFSIFHLEHFFIIKGPLCPRNAFILISQKFFTFGVFL
jgi:hypothetical protein